MLYSQWMVHAPPPAPWLRAQDVVGCRPTGPLHASPRHLGPRQVGTHCINIIIMILLLLIIKMIASKYIRSNPNFACSLWRNCQIPSHFTCEKILMGDEPELAWESNFNMTIGPMHCVHRSKLQHLKHTPIGRDFSAQILAQSEGVVRSCNLARILKMLSFLAFFF